MRIGQNSGRLSQQSRPRPGRRAGLAWFACAFGAAAVAQAQTATETIIQTFGNFPQGAIPYGTLIRDTGGDPYGTAYQGGAANAGVVFRLNGSGYKVLYSFKGGTDGANPYAGVTVDAAGNLYGTTYNGGAAGKGAVYKLEPSGQETVLYSFTGGADGANPYHRHNVCLRRLVIGAREERIRVAAGPGLGRVHGEVRYVLCGGVLHIVVGHRKISGVGEGSQHDQLDGAVAIGVHPGVEVRDAVEQFEIRGVKISRLVRAVRRGKRGLIGGLAGEAVEEVGTARRGRGQRARGGGTALGPSRKGQGRRKLRGPRKPPGTDALTGAVSRIVRCHHLVA